MKIIGLDVGFGFTKVCIEDKQLKFPSVVGSYEEPGFHDIEDNVSENGKENVTVGGQHLLVGEKAIRRSTRIFTTREKNWINTSAYKALVKHACRLAGHKYGELCRIITGLPVAHYKKCKEDLSRIIEEIAGPKAEVRIILQPLGSYFDCLLDDEALVKDEELLQSTVGAIDIGFFTVDFVTMKKLHFVRDSHESYEGGMATAYRRIAKAVYDYYDCKREVYEIEEIIKNGYIMAYGEKKDVRSIIDKNLMNLEAEIKAKATTLWKEGADIDVILLTGGGANILGDKMTFYRHIRTVNVPQFANARGYYKYGRRIEYGI